MEGKNSVMITERNQTHISRLQLASLYQLMHENSDTTSANKLLQVYEKWDRQDFMISFAGHFSAGKSSMINHLLGRSILPKSPIPTSANIVKIRSGNGFARIHLENGSQLEYEEPYDIDMIKAYAKDKAAIKEIEINTPGTILTDDSVIFDTPGIDAADDADRLITESSLHLVDALFYVMDYNHVQSEVNLYFLKKVQDYAIPVYLIINQIDKHDEQELLFQTFSDKIKQTFDQWEIFPKKIYYSSLMECSAPFNQIDDIKKKLLAMMTADKQMSNHISRSVNQVINEHKGYLRQLYEGETVQTEIQEGEPITDTVARLDELHAHVSYLNHIPERMQHDFYDALNVTMKNAYLMPADLRDLAQSFLASQQSDFKVGLFASKKKTKEERQKRIDAFLTGLQQTIETAIQWKIRDKWLQLLQAYDVHDQELMQRIQNLSLTYDANSLKALIKPGAKVNGDYVLHYTNDVSADVKQKFKQKAVQLWDMIHDKISEKITHDLSAYAPERERLERIYEQHEQHEKQMVALQEKWQEVDNTFTNPNAVSYDSDLIDKALVAKHKSVKAAEPLPVQETHESAATETNEHVMAKPVVAGQHILDHLEKTRETIADLPGFQALRNDLQRKYDRLDNRTYTIALFGAFSAGKSSFANALIGEDILPSAPNPTTAVINRISPVTEEHAHGTVVLHLKDEATLVNDLKSLTRQFKPQADDLASLLAWVKDRAIHQSDQLAKTQQAFLTAMLDGYRHSKANIGQHITIDVHEFADYVTDETKACYLESVDLYYDCSVTREGITLVDTPGADSINARHTNVAFDYIKQADAILYVTYYNHPFSRADKDFLMQLGRVKDAFQLDKMFFIMNASDLAETISEQNMVQQYIEDQLAALGIRFPRLFPVSSKRSLKEKRHNRTLNKQMTAFEEAFNRFIHDELTSMTVQSAVRDIKRARQSVHHYRRSMQMDVEEKERARTELLTKEESLKQLTQAMDTGVYEQKISQKMEKQLYYVLERLSIRFHDLFKESFNPTTITDSGKKAQQQLADSLRNLLDYAGYELLQELRAVSLRIESFIDDIQEELFHHYTNKSSPIDGTFILPDFEKPELTTPNYEQAFIQLDSGTFDQELKQFNGTKAFFAKNEKEKMKEGLFNRLYPFAKEYIAANEEKMRASYLQQWYDIIDHVKQFIKQQIESYIANQLQMINDQSVDSETLNEKHEVLTSILAYYEEVNL
ncbi:dynamin family protein [Lentibacillus salinarum]|uniref:Dynamin family protein n=1 Tax=Lentibacillus salinarum TaxID=446820 RepID=A0ABW3ZQS2_9BACI